MCFYVNSTFLSIRDRSRTSMNVECGPNNKIYTYMRINLYMGLFIRNLIARGLFLRIISEGTKQECIFLMTTIQEKSDGWKFIHIRT